MIFDYAVKITLVWVILKLYNIVDVTWFWVFSPIWMFFLITGIISYISYRVISYRLNNATEEINSFYNKLLNRKNK